MGHSVGLLEPHDHPEDPEGVRGGDLSVPVGVPVPRERGLEADHVPQDQQGVGGAFFPSPLASPGASSTADSKVRVPQPLGLDRMELSPHHAIDGQGVIGQGKSTSFTTTSNPMLTPLLGTKSGIWALEKLLQGILASKINPPLVKLHALS